MDDIKRPSVKRGDYTARGRGGSLAYRRADGAAPQISGVPVGPPAPPRKTVTIRLSVRPLRWARGLLGRNGRGHTRLAFGMVAVTVLISQVLPVFHPNLAKRAYALGAAEGLLPETSQTMASKLRHDAEKATYEFNEGYSPQVDNKKTTGGPRITATAYEDPSKGVSVLDPDSNIQFGIKPKFGLLQGRQDGNRVVYPLSSGIGWLVYTMQGIRMKEDVLLTKAPGDRLVLKYTLDMNEGLAARLRKDGSIGVFGSSLPLSGNVSTGSDKDNELLQKARQKAPKDKLIFTIPPPIAYEHNKTRSDVKVHYELDGKELKVVSTGLKGAQYPLTIDPSIYVETASKFMRANLESNIDFDSANELIEKGILTGASIDSWSTTGMVALSNARWNQATAIGGGFIYSVGGKDTANNQADVQWAQVSVSDQTTDAATPGITGQCTNWCTSGNYNLPANRSGHSLVIYNGYMYAIGGTDSTCTAGNTTGNNSVCYTVYAAKLGPNGEPQLWRPTTSDPFAYWYRTTNLNTERSYAGAVAYKGRLYMVGGQTGSSSNGDLGMESALIEPNGKLSTWTSGGSYTALPSSGRWGHSVLQYNGYIYVVGGVSTGVVQNDIRYIKINSDGTLASTWATPANTTGVFSARASYGGNFATIWGGYMYVNGGCSAITTTTCTVISSDTVKMASMNADGSVSDWATLSGPTLTRTGYGLVAWRNTLYTIGGCGVNVASSNCSTPQTATAFGAIDEAGEVSPNEAQTALPTLGATDTTAGRSSGGVAIKDGYIYWIGGCVTLSTTSSCDASGEMNDNALYAPIAADGTLGAWTIVANAITGGSGIAGGTAVVYNNFLYHIGGYVGTGFVTTIYKSTIDINGTHAPGVFAAEATGALPSSYGWVGATTRPQNATSGYMYIFGGCNNAGINALGAACAGSYQQTVLRCSITNSTGVLGACATSGWNLPDIERSTTGSNQGIGAFGFAVWGDYVYIAGGLCGTTGTSGQTALENGCDGTSAAPVNMLNSRHVYYSRFDSSGGLVKPPTTGAACGTVANGNIDPTVWCKSDVTLNMARRLNAAMVVNGYLYVVGGQQAIGSQVALTDVEVAKINPDTGDLAGVFNTLSQGGSTALITGGWGQGFVANSGYLYLVGGCQVGNSADGCTSMTGAVDKLQVYNNFSGSPNVYAGANVTNLPDLYGASTAIYEGRIYVVGGCTTTTDCASPTAANYYTTINADGNVSNWNVGTTTGFVARAFGCLAVVGGYLYYLGGRDTTNAAAEVYYNQLTAGVPGTWSGASGDIGDTSGQAAQARFNPGCAVVNNRIYVSGGSATVSATYSNDVYVTPSLATGGDIGANLWTSTTAFTTNRNGHVLVAYSNTLYLMGGFDGTNYLMDTQYVGVNDDSTGTIGTWQYGTPLPRPVRQGTGFAANGYLYLISGRSASTTCMNDTYIAPILAYDPDPPSSTRTGLGAWSQANVTFSIDRYGASAAFYEGRAYVVGGTCNGTTATTTNKVPYATLLSQPQVASYSLMIDTDTNVFPTYWLFNGTDYGIGTQWTLQYKSSTDSTDCGGTAMTTWGQTTTVSSVELERAGTYTPKNGAGTNTNCTRYFYFLMTIDASQGFGFAEDVERGPKIADMSLFFTSDPSKRLMHGRTFTGGEQQPLDTPPTISNPQ